MCIICNAGHDDEALKAADDFLISFSIAGSKMKDAESAMELMSRKAVDEKSRKRYSKIHKKMVRIRKGWNGLEQIREDNSVLANVEVCDE